MKYDWLLFDADGTLFDYDKAEAVALKETFESFGISFTPSYLQTYRSINAQIWKDFELGKITQKEIKTQRFQLLLDAVGKKEAAADFGQTYLTNLGNGTYLINGTEELLEFLNGQVKMMIITNGLKNVQRSRLSQSTIAHYFDDVIISEEVGSAKPDPQMFDITFQKMGNPAKDKVLIIGDSLTSDMTGGHRYGIDTCWYNPTGATCNLNLKLTFEIKNLSEIPGIVSA